MKTSGLVHQVYWSDLLLEVNKDVESYIAIKAFACLKYTTWLAYGMLRRCFRKAHTGCYLKKTTMAKDGQRKCFRCVGIWILLAAVTKQRLSIKNVSIFILQLNMLLVTATAGSDVWLCRIDQCTRQKRIALESRRFESTHTKEEEFDWRRASS